MHLAELGDLERQVAKRFEPVLEDLYVARAIHGLDDVGARVVVAMLREKHHLTEFLHMSGSHPERGIHELGRIDLEIAGRGLAAADVALEQLIEGPSLRMPEHRARRLLLEME